jgi:hypothetical protein
VFVFEDGDGDEREDAGEEGGEHRERILFFCFSFVFSHQAREAGKSGLLLFHTAIWKFDDAELEESFARFERAAAKGHEESIWILSVVKGVKMEESVLKEVFAKTEEHLGWYFVGQLSYGKERFDFHKKSAEGGCSWGQVDYGMYFKFGGEFVEKDQKFFVEWLEKAAKQNNPYAMDCLGYWFRNGGEDEEKAVSYWHAGAELGWKNAMVSLVDMLRDGNGCVKDLRQAVILVAKGARGAFWNLLEDARRALENRATEDLDCDFDQLCYSLGWGLYWYQYDTRKWNERSDEEKAFGTRFLDYYCCCVELQQKSIFTFLLCWNRMTGGVKGPGQMIAQMVWEEREDNLLKRFE